MAEPRPHVSTAAGLPGTTTAAWYGPHATFETGRPSSAPSAASGSSTDGTDCSWPSLPTATVRKGAASAGTRAIA